MPRLILLSSVLLFSLLLIQCGKPPDLKGYYQGQFILSENGVTRVGPAKVRLRDSSYQSEGQTDRIPAGGSGDWEIQDSVVIFRDKNIWTADFDWHLILDGKYSYSVLGDSLILTADRPNGKSYIYRLKKMTP